MKTKLKNIDWAYIYSQFKESGMSLRCFHSQILGLLVSGKRPGNKYLY